MESQLPDAKSTQVDEASAALDTTAHRQAQQSAKCSDGSVSVAHDEPAQGGRLFHRQPVMPRGRESDHDVRNLQEESDSVG